MRSDKKVNVMYYFNTLCNFLYVVFYNYTRTTYQAQTDVDTQTVAMASQDCVSAEFPWLKTCHKMADGDKKCPIFRNQNVVRVLKIHKHYLLFGLDDTYNTQPKIGADIDEILDYYTTKWYRREEIEPITDLCQIFQTGRWFCTYNIGIALSHMYKIRIIDNVNVSIVLRLCGGKIDDTLIVTVPEQPLARCGQLLKKWRKEEFSEFLAEPDEELAIEYCGGDDDGIYGDDGDDNRSICSDLTGYDPFEGQEPTDEIDDPAIDAEEAYYERTNDA